MPEVSHVYTELVERLLYMDSTTAIQDALQNIPHLDEAALLATFTALEVAYRTAGYSAQQQLLNFVRSIVNESLHPPESDRPRFVSARAITTLDELVQHAIDATDSIRVYILLRRHRHLLNREVFEKTLEQTIIKHKKDIAWFRLTSVLGMVLQEPSTVVQGHLTWAAYCRDHELYIQAERHLTHASFLVEGVQEVTLQAKVVGALGGLYDRVGQTARAAECYREALDLALQEGDEGTAYAIRQYLARCYRTLGRTTEALDMINQYIARVHALNLLREETQSYRFKGLVLDDLGRYDEGELAYQQAAHLAAHCHDQQQQFRALNDSAFSLLKRGLVREGIARFRHVLETVERWGNPVAIASVRSNLGQALLSKQDYAGAINEFNHAFLIKAEAQDTRGEMISTIGMADALQGLEEAEAARTFYTMALVPALRLLLEQNDPFGIFLLATHAPLDSLQLGEDTTGLLTWGLQLAEASGNAFQAITLSMLLIQQQITQGNEQVAIEMYKETLQRYAGPDTHTTAVMRLQIGLAHLLVKQTGRRREAYELLTQLLASIEKDMHTVILNQRKAEMVAQWIELYGLLIRLLLEDGEALGLPASIDRYELAFNLHEAAKARSFLAQLAGTSIQQPETIPSKLRVREMQLLAAAREFQSEDGSQDRAVQVFRLQRLQEIQGQLHDCWEEMRVFAPEYVRIRQGEPVKLREVQEFLAAYATTSMALVSFFCDAESTTCFVIRSDDTRLHVFRSAVGQQHLHAALRGLQEAFNGQPEIRAQQPWTRDRKLRAFYALSAELLTFLPALQGCELVCMLPHGALHLLPLHALRVDDDSFLIERFAVTYSPSLSVLRYCFSKAAPTSTEHPSLYVAGVAASGDLHPEFFEQDDEIFRSLSWEVTADMGALAASKLRVQQNLGLHDMIHLTCHGYFDAQDPLSSGLLLSDGRERPPSEIRSQSFLQRALYTLSARDILRTSMHAQIVMLRACSTGLQNERNTGDEFEGLSRALLYAGNATVVVSLWNVDKETSQALVTRFYRYWTTERATGQRCEKWRALWMAQKDFLTTGTELFLCHPYHWAPLILIGDWR